MFRTWFEDVARGLVSFFRDHWPRTDEIWRFGLPALGVAYAFLAVCAWLRANRGVRTADTRKVFHFLVFLTAGGVQAVAGTRLLCLFGIAVSLVVFYALLRGRGHPLFEALARETDAPRRRHYVVVPYAATLVGGVASNVLFGPAAVYGYLVTGLGDALAEPVGVRWGAHRYRVPALRGVRVSRSLEGSLTVLIASLLVFLLAGVAGDGVEFTGRFVLRALGVGVGCAVVEAVSPHGWDNLTLQLAASGGAAWAF